MDAEVAGSVLKNRHPPTRNCHFLTVVSVRARAFRGVSELRKESAVKKFLKLLKDVSGASAAEYALILAIVGAAIALAAVNLGGAIKGALDNTTETINNPPTATP